MFGVRTTGTGEGGLIRSVALVDCSALRAAFARIARIDEVYGHSSKFCLVGNETLKLSERPVPKPSAMLAAGLDPCADMLEVFKPYAAPGALRLDHDFLRYEVVFVFLEPLLFLGELAQLALRGLGSALLQTSTAARDLGSNLLDLVASVHFAVAVGCDVDDPKIDAEHLGNANQFRLVNVADACEIEDAFDQHQIDLALAERKHVALPFSHFRLDLDTTIDRQDRNNITGLEADYPVIIGLGGVLAESALGVPVELVGIRDLGNAAHGRLSAKSEGLPCVAVAQLVHRELIEFFFLPGHCGKVVAGCIAALKRLAESFLLLVRGHQLYVCYQLHISYIEDCAVNVNPKKARKARIPLPAKAGSLQRED